jgi:hypothetical protein
MRFDLSELQDLPPIRARRVGHWLGLGVAIVFVFTVAYSVLGYAIVHRGFDGWSARASLALVIPAFGVATGVFVFAQTGPGDEYVEVNEEGVTFARLSGHKSSVRWSDPRLSLHFELTNGVTRRGGQGVPMIFLARRFPAQSYLTRSAYDAIIQQASQRGLRVSTGPSDWIVGWERSLVTRG